MISKAVSSHREIYENKLDVKNYFSENLIYYTKIFFSIIVLKVEYELGRLLN
jgi:hypothetical protein